MKHGQQVPGLKILVYQAVRRVNILRTGMEEKEGDTMLTVG